MVRLRVAVIGQASELALISVPIDTDAATIRAEITAKAAVKLAVTPPTDTGSVRMFLPGGAGSQHPTAHRQLVK